MACKKIFILYSNDKSIFSIYQKVGKMKEIIHSQILILKEQGWERTKKQNEYYVFLEKDGTTIKVSKETGKIVSEKIKKLELSP